MSVDTRTKGRRLDSYSTQHPLTDVSVLLDTDLVGLRVEVTVTTAGVLRRGVGMTVEGINGAACPIELV